MRVVITGHTGGLGLAFFNFFKERGDEVVGLSRSTGFLLPDKFDEICEIAENSDLFVNNVHSETTQIKFLLKLYSKTSIFTSGSIASDYPKKEFMDYSLVKKALEVEHKRLKKISPYPMLLLKMGFLENTKQNDPIPFQQIINSVDFWLKNPRASMIEFDNIHYYKGFTI